MTNYPFVLSDAGRSESKRPKQKDDCTVIALAHTTGMSYDAAYEELKDRGRKSHRRFHFREAVADGIREYAFIWMSFPAVKGERRMNPETFCKTHTVGKYILKTAKHVCAVIDGVLHDTWEQRNDRCVYGVWKVEEIL